MLAEEVVEDEGGLPFGHAAPSSTVMRTAELSSMPVLGSRRWSARTRPCDAFGWTGWCDANGHCSRESSLWTWAAPGWHCSSELIGLREPGRLGGDVSVRSLAALLGQE